MVASSFDSSDRSHSRILLVDDNRNGLVARKTVLEELGYHIVAVDQASEAWERFQREAFDLVITDYKMPRMSGLELIRRIREHSPGIPILLISGFADTLGLTEASTGADLVLQKSANEVQQMVRAVARLLKKKVAPKKPPTSARGASKTQASPKSKSKGV